MCIVSPSIGELVFAFDPVRLNIFTLDDIGSASQDCIILSFPVDEIVRRFCLDMDMIGPFCVTPAYNCR